VLSVLELNTGPTLTAWLPDGRAERFHFFALKLLHITLDASLHGQLGTLMHERILECAGTPSDGAGAVYAGAGGPVMGLLMEQVLAALPLQCEDGRWGPSWMYKCGSSNIKIGNRGLTTALVLNAIAILDESHLHPSLRSCSPSDPPLPQSPQSWLGSSTVTPFLHVSMALSGTSSVPLPSLPSSTTPPSCCEILKRSKSVRRGSH
jgi:hypothetical protein